MNILRELNKFKDIKFYEQEHKYIINGHTGTSVTTLIKKYEHEFNADYWASKKADQLNITKEEILKEWDEKRIFSSNKGNYLHKYAENMFYNKVYEEYSNEVPVALKETLSCQFDKFYDNISSKVYPVGAEVVIGDFESKTCGMIDFLCASKKTDNLQIWDWKTNKKINKKSWFGKFKPPLDHLDNCEFNKYSLQLAFYKFIIEKNTNLTISDCYIIWFNEKNKKAEVIKCKPLENEVKHIYRQLNIK